MLHQIGETLVRIQGLRGPDGKATVRRDLACGLEASAAPAACAGWHGVGLAMVSSRKSQPPEGFAEYPWLLLPERWRPAFAGAAVVTVATGMVFTVRELASMLSTRSGPTPVAELYCWISLANAAREVRDNALILFQTRRNA